MPWTGEGDAGEFTHPFLPTGTSLHVWPCSRASPAPEPALQQGDTALRESVEGSPDSNPGLIMML
jgi:hypothetical protein